MSNIIESGKKYNLVQTLMGYELRDKEGKKHFYFPCNILTGRDMEAADAYARAYFNALEPTI